MRAFQIAIVLACAAMLLAHTEEKEESKEETQENTDSNQQGEMNEFDRQHANAGILVLTDENYEETIKSHPAVLVKFYAPWCIHSREFAPEYIKAGLFLMERNSTIRLARVDASVNKKFAEKYNVKDYPTLKFFKGDSVADYSGGKTGLAVASWVETKIKPPTKNITTVSEAHEFTAADAVTILGLFPKENFTKMSESFAETVFTRLDEIPCGVTDIEEVLAHYGVTEDTLIMFKNLDKEQLKYEGPFDSESIAKFVKANKLPLVVEFTHYNAPDIFNGNVTKHLLVFVHKANQDEFQANFGQMHEPAKIYKGRVIFIYVNMDNTDNDMILQFFGVKKSDPPSVRMIALDLNMSKFRPTFKTITSDGLTAFVRDVLEGKIEPHLPSQDIPEDWDKNPVKVLVAKNFDEVTMDKSKTVFVMFYAPWCEHSKMLAPIWEELAKDYAHNDTIVIAKMDSSENELGDMKIRSFPTLKLFPANSNDVFDYYGLDRTLKSLKIFLDSGGKKQPGINDNEEPNKDSNEGKTDESKGEKSANDEEGSVKSEDADGADETVKQEL